MCRYAWLTVKRVVAASCRLNLWEGGACPGAGDARAHAVVELFVPALRLAHLYAKQIVTLCDHRLC